MNDFKDMLAYLRKREGLSQRELASKLHISPSAIGMYESGQRYPSREQEEAIADFFNVNLSTLRGRSESIEEKYSAKNAELYIKIQSDKQFMEFIRNFDSLDDMQKRSIMNLVSSMVKK